MPDIHIKLPPNMTSEHFRVVLKYFEKSKRLTPQEWRLALKSFNTLDKANVIIDKKQMSFQQFYDFYITRIVDTNRRQYLWIVLMKESFWRESNGEVVSTSSETVTKYLPQPVQIVLQAQSFVVVPFELWKEKVRERQKEEN